MREIQEPGRVNCLKRLSIFWHRKGCAFIEGDGDHRWARNDDNWKSIRLLIRRLIFLYRQADNIRKLKRGNHVERSDYDHDTGKFTEVHRIDAKKYIVLCGLHSLYLPALRDELDLKVFMDTEQELRNFWKIERDTKRQEVTQRKNSSSDRKAYSGCREKYIYPQKEYADMIITYFDKTLKSCYEDNHEVSLSVRFELTLNMDVEPLIKSFEKYGVHPEHRICNDFYHQGTLFDGRKF